MEMTLSVEDLQSYVSAQLKSFFPDKNPVNLSDYSKEIDMAIDRLDFCFKKVTHSRYNSDGKTTFNHLYADQYLIFIWFLSNTIWQRGNGLIANKLYYLNRVLHAFDCMYDTGMPDCFLIFHGAGTMLGKAIYNNYFVAFQGCTVGANRGKYPAIGKGVTLTSHSSIIGNCLVGDNVTISSHTSVFETNIIADSVVFTDRTTGQFTLKPSDRPFAQQFFRIDD
jgi:serine O-acetyltransferase